MRRDHGGAVDAVIDASVNVNPLGPPESLAATFGRVRELSARYPQIDAADARRAWARRVSARVEQVLVGNGASELISLVVRTLAPRRVVVFDPCYSEYAVAARAAGAPVARVTLELADARWHTPPAAALAGRAERGEAGATLGPGDLVVVGRPNNPTGHLTGTEALLEIAATGAHVLADESFLELASLCSAAREAPFDSLVPHVDARISVVTSLTKTYCVPGLRLGVLVAHTDLIERISEMRDPWSVNGVAAEAAAVLAHDDDYLARSRELLSAEKPRLTAALAALPGVRVTEGVAPWVLAELPHPHDARSFRARMLERGVAVRDASTFEGLSERWVRVAVRTAAENGAIVRAVTEVL